MTSRSDKRPSRPDFWRLPPDADDEEAPLEFDEDAHAEWCAKWAPRCPDGNPVTVRRALGFRERSTRELELRVALGESDLGVCDVILDERDDEIYVRVLVCQDDDDDRPRRQRGYMDCPVRTWLERPLGGRAVIDVDSDEELPLFIPGWDREPREESRYVSVERRRTAERDDARVKLRPADGAARRRRP